MMYLDFYVIVLEFLVFELINYKPNPVMKDSDKLQCCVCHMGSRGRRSHRLATCLNVQDRTANVVTYI